MAILEEMPDLEVSVGLGEGSSHVDTDVIHPVILLNPEIIVMVTIVIV
jgi:hypothetical protein